jgi:SAM-dependent methyltransferase
MGGGPGRYAFWLAGSGYAVELRDPVPLHVEQVRAANVPAVRAAVGDARSLDLSDASVDAVLLLGPLYHLADRSERVRALREARRIVRPGGPVFIAVISRWAPRLDGTLIERLYKTAPAALGLLDEVEHSGHLPPLAEGSFTGYTHRPADVAGEIADTLLDLEDRVDRHCSTHRLRPSTQTDSGSAHQKRRLADRSPLRHQRPAASIPVDVAVEGSACEQARRRSDASLRMGRQLEVARTSTRSHLAPKSCTASSAPSTA